MKSKIILELAAAIYKYHKKLGNQQVNQSNIRSYLQMLEIADKEYYELIIEQIRRG